MNSRQDFYDKCRTDYNVFTYNGFSYTINPDGIDICYEFTIEGLAKFTPSWHIDIMNGRNRNIKKDIVEEIIFSLGMIELISYWKIACPRTVIIKDRRLSPSQIGWWKKLYFNGLGEFYYKNGIEENFDDFMNIICNGSAKESKLTNQASFSTTRIGHKKPACLIPVGGGKDSVVSLELLKDKTDRFCYVINPNNASLSTLEVGGLKDKTIFACRSLDDKMLDLNAQGFLNGHTPYSALVAFSSLLAAYLNDLEFVVLSNEASANETTIVDSYINHQYSKSFEFESDFRSYERKYFASGVYFFSVLRPLSEIQIAMLFSRMKKYHGAFKSCYTRKERDNWCCQCSKCLFAYIILSPFLPLSELDGIFGKRLFENESLIGDFDKLCGLVPEKPFECVGSRGEVNASLTETIKQYESLGIELPVLLTHYKAIALSPETEFANYKTNFAAQHALTPYFKDLVTAALRV